MSMQICVLSDSRLSSVAEWQQYIDAEGFPLRLSGVGPSAAADNLPAQLRETKTDIEYEIYDLNDLKDTYKGFDFRHDWQYVIAFTWVSDFSKEIAAWMAATAYARATGGVVFDEQEAKLFTPDKSLKIVREIERRQPEMEAALRDFMQQLSARS